MTQLARSGVNLFDSAEAFVRMHDDIVALCAYIKKPTLEKLNESGKINQVVVAWRMQDICSGASDFEELYQYCRDHNIELFRNPRIHLKVLWDMGTNVFLGSANISQRGLDDTSGDAYNWELSTKVQNISFGDQQYLNKLLSESTLITPIRMEELRTKKEAIHFVRPEVPDHHFVPDTTDKFLITELPYFEFDFLPEDRFQDLVQAYLNPEDLSTEQQIDLAHDLTIYRIPPDLPAAKFEQVLRQAFNAHPFIVAFKEKVKNHEPRFHPKGTINHGGVNKWLRQKTTTVPTPKHRDMKDKVTILYNWICHFDSSFNQSGRPNGKGSNILKYNKSDPTLR